MLWALHLIGVTSALVSCFFWLAAAVVRFKPLSLFRLRGPESLPGALERQSALNGLAALCAALAAGCQAAIFLMGS